MQLAVTDAHKAQFTEQGYAVLEGVLEPARVAELRARIMELAEWEKSCGEAHLYDGVGRMQRIWNLLNKGEAWRELIQMPVILEFMEWIFDRPTVHQKFLLSSFQANIIYPQAPPLKLHIDTPVPEPLPAWVIKANTIWLLDTFTATNGATEVLPGSHRFSNKPGPADQDRTDLQAVSAPAGSVLVIHGALWHRSGANRSDRERVVLLGSFAASYAREIASEEDYFRVLEPEVLARSSDTLKRILGADHGVRPGARTAPPRR